MKILDRFIGAELIIPFVFGVAAFTSIFFAGQNLLTLTNLVLDGLPVVTAIELVALSLPAAIVYTLPMSTLLAVLIAFSRLSNDSEIVALYASGISLYRTIIMVFILGIAVTILSFVMTEFVVPGSNRLTQDIQARALKEDISTNKPFVVIDKGTNSTIYVKGGLDAKTHSMRDVTITRYAGNEPVIIFQAKKARWEGQSYQGTNNWVLSDGSWYKLNLNGSSESGAFEDLKTETIQA